MAKPALKKAPAVRVVAILLLLAPVLNLWISYSLISSESAVAPVNFLLHVQFYDWFFMGMVMIAGGALLKQHKTNWLYACLILVLVASFNLINFASPTGTDSLSQAPLVQLVFSSFLGLSVVILIAYSRYPYLDRRDGWILPAAMRFDVTLPVKVHIEGQWVDGTCENISTSGCRLRLAGASMAPKAPGMLDLRFVEFGETVIPSKIVLSDGPVVRVKFQRLPERRREFSDWVLSKG